MIKRCAYMLLCALWALTCARAFAETEIIVSDEQSHTQVVGAQASVGTEIYLYVNPDSASYVTFKVVDDDGEPIAGARIYLSLGGYEELYGATDEHGELACYLFRDTRYGFKATKYGHLSASGAFSATGDTRRVNITLQKFRRVEVFVVDGEIPVQGAQITISGESNTTGANGNALFELVNGIYDAYVTPPDGDAIYVRFSVEGDTVLVVDIAAPPDEEQGEKLHDEILDTGGGLGDLFILFDRNYEPDNYLFFVETYSDEDILAVLPEDLSDEERAQLLAILREALPNTVRVTAQPDMTEREDGTLEEMRDEFGNPVYSHRNLLMSCAQIANLRDMEIDTLTLENEQMNVSLRLSELSEDRLAKLIVLLYELDDTALDDIALDEMLTREALDDMLVVTTWLDDLAPDEYARLTYDMFARAMLEIRVTPILEGEYERALVAAAGVDEDSRAVTLNGEALSATLRRARMDRGYLTGVEQLELSALKPASKAYRAQVYLTVNGIEADITALLDTLTVSISAQDMLNMERERLMSELDIEALGISDAELHARAREAVMARVTLASILSAGDIFAEDYVIGAHTTLLDTALVSDSEMDAEALKVLISTLQELYDVKIIDGELVMEQRALTVPRAVVYYDGEVVRDVFEDYRLVASAPVNGLYLAAEGEFDK